MGLEDDLNIFVAIVCRDLGIPKPPKVYILPRSSKPINLDGRTGYLIGGYNYDRQEIYIPESEVGDRNKLYEILMHEFYHHKQLHDMGREKFEHIVKSSNCLTPECNPLEKDAKMNSPILAGAYRDLFDAIVQEEYKPKTEEKPPEESKVQPLLKKESIIDEIDITEIPEIREMIESFKQRMFREGYPIRRTEYAVDMAKEWTYSQAHAFIPDRFKGDEKYVKAFMIDTFRMAIEGAVRWMKAFGKS